jgi:voltage-gated potassium channel
LTSTVGFGDLAANSDAARALVTVQMLVDLALVGGLVRLVMLAARMGLHRQDVARPKHRFRARGGRGVG